jgi:hypothetical protein
MNLIGEQTHFAFFWMILPIATAIGSIIRTIEFHWENKQIEYERERFTAFQGVVFLCPQALYSLISFQGAIPLPLEFGPNVNAVHTSVIGGFDEITSV